MLNKKFLLVLKECIPHCKAFSSYQLHMKKSTSLKQDLWKQVRKHSRGYNFTENSRILKEWQDIQLNQSLLIKKNQNVLKQSLQVTPRSSTMLNVWGRGRRSFLSIFVGSLVKQRKELLQRVQPILVQNQCTVKKKKVTTIFQSIIIHVTLSILNIRNTPDNTVLVITTKPTMLNWYRKGSSMWKRTKEIQIKLQPPVYLGYMK